MTAPKARIGVLLEAFAYAIVASQPSFWHTPVPLWRAAIAVPIGIVAVATVWLAVPVLGKQWRVEAGLNADHDLIQAGPYAVVRHPIYASMLGMLLVNGIMMSSWPFLLVAIVLFVMGTEIRVHEEDRLLEGRFGERFTLYKSRVRAYVPFVR